MAKGGGRKRAPEEEKQPRRQVYSGVVSPGGSERGSVEDEIKETSGRVNDFTGVYRLRGVDLMSEVLLSPENLQKDKTGDDIEVLDHRPCLVSPRVIYKRLHDFFKTFLFYIKHSVALPTHKVPSAGGFLTY